MYIKDLVSSLNIRLIRVVILSYIISSKFSKLSLILLYNSVAKEFPDFDRSLNSFIISLKLELSLQPTNSLEFSFILKLSAALIVSELYPGSFYELTNIFKSV